MTQDRGSYELELDFKEKLSEGETKTVDEEREAKRKEKMERLDASAKTLLTATTILIALFAAVGLTADRFAVLLNSSPSKAALIAAMLSAAVAVVLGTVAIATDNLHAEIALVTLGALAILVSLGAAVYAASSSFTEDGRPAITEISLGDAAKGLGADLSFSVSSDGVAQDAGLRVVSIWVRNPGESNQEPPFYTAILRPNAKGVIQQKVTVHLSRPVEAHYVRIQVIRTSDDAQSQVLTKPPVGVLCSDQGSQRTAPACADVLVPAAHAEQ